MVYNRRFILILLVRFLREIYLKNILRKHTGCAIISNC